MIAQTDIEPVIIDLSLGCTAEQHKTDCTFNVVSIAQTSCSNEVETWCASAYGFWEYSALVGDHCFDCERLIADCWIVNSVDG